MDLVLATSNAHKIQEIKALLPPHFRVLGLSDIGFTDEIEETSGSIKGNSLLKAQTVINFLSGKKIGAAVIADDSGLEVEALGGRPGVYSARYAGEKADAAANNKKLLTELAKITKRRARFVTIITLIYSGETRFFEGEVKGTVAYEPRGISGFGYDPLFIPAGYRSTFAELPPEEKNRISHRGQAVKKLVSFLESL